MQQSREFMPAIFKTASTEKGYLRQVEVLDTLIDMVGEDETHPLASVMEIVGVLIEKYEDEHVLEITAI